MSDPSELDLRGLSLSRIASLAEGCTACELYEDATQVVFGDGPQSASLMLLGEQPGDQEDRAGEPFVGPAGDLLDDALIEAGVDRSEVYITNAVKHFRFEEKGKRRLHKKPTHRHVSACRPWLEAELAKVGPEVIVTLGASAAQSILGRSIRVMSDHGAPVEWEQCLVVPTIHPSFRAQIVGRRGTAGRAVRDARSRSEESH